MIEAEVRLTGDLLSSVRVNGHAGTGPTGADPVCAAVTLLVRSVARLLATSREVRVWGSAPGEGELRYTVRPANPGARPWLAGVTAVLMQGLRDMAAESPEGLRLIERSE